MAEVPSKSKSYDQLRVSLPQSFESVTGIEWNHLVRHKTALEKLAAFKEAVALTAKHLHSSPSIEEELQLLRDLMLLANTRPANPAESVDDAVLKKCLCINFTFLLVGRANGLRKWITAAFDLDDTSQMETTFDQRFISASRVVAYVPESCVPMPIYYHLIAKQIWSLLLDKTLEPLKEGTRHCIRRLCNMIVTAMVDRKKKVGRHELITPVLEALNPECRSGSCVYKCCDILDESHLKFHPCKVETPQQSLEIIYSLLFGRSELKNFAESGATFAHILYIRLALDRSLSPWKSRCDFMVSEMLNRIGRNSIHLLISALFIDYDKYCDAFCVAHPICEGASSSNSEIIISFSSEPSKSSELDLEKIDCLSRISLRLIDSFDSEKKVSFILLLFDELSRIHLKSQSTGLLLCTLMGELMDTLEPLVKKHPGLFIKFLVASIDRAVSSDSLSDEDGASNKIPVNMEENVDDNHPGLSLLHIDTVQISLQIIKVLLLHKDKLSIDDIKSLKSMQETLSRVRDKVASAKLDQKLCKNEKESDDSEPQASEVTADQIDEIIKEISSLSMSKSSSQNREENRLERALKELNDPIMPTRAHALISIKNMIVSLDPLVIDRKKQLLELLIACLSDAESYIYLATIGTLEMAARLDTATVLPVLLSHYSNENRTIQERLNTGETIVRLSKCLGPTAPVYAKQMISCFTDSLKDEEALIRVSSLSNLAQLCKALRHSLAPHITQVMHSIFCLLRGDCNLDVKRSALMFIHITLSGVDADCIHAIQEQLVPILKQVRTTYDVTIDDISRLHAQLAIEELERLVRELTHRVDYESLLSLKPAKPVQIIE